MTYLIFISQFKGVKKLFNRASEKSEGSILFRDISYLATWIWRNWSWTIKKHF